MLFGFDRVERRLDKSVMVRMASARDESQSDISDPWSSLQW